MAMTPRQERTGVSAPAATGGNVAQPGPMPDLASVMRQAKRAGDARASAAKLAVPRDVGVQPWSQGLAVREVGSG